MEHDKEIRFRFFRKMGGIFDIRNLNQRLKERLKETRRELDFLTSIQLSSVSIIFTLFMILPLLSVVYTAFYWGGSFSLGWFKEIFSNPFYWAIRIEGTNTFPFFKIKTYFRGSFFYQAGDTFYIRGIDMGVILNSLFVAAMTTVFSTILGVIAAFIMARYKFLGKTILSTMLIIPLLSTPFVGSIGVLRMIDRNGIINTIFYDMLHIFPYRIVLQGLAAIIFVQTLHFFTLVYLNTYTSLVNIDPSLEEQAENLGAKGWTLFRTVTLPLALPGIQAGAILVFILSVEDVGTPIVFQFSQQARKTLAFQVYSNIFAPTGEIDPIAPTLGTILLVIAILGFLLVRRYVTLRRYAMLSKGGVWNPRIRKLEPLKTVLIYIYLVGLLVVALIPHIGVFLLSIAKEWRTGAIFPTVWGPDNFIYLFTNDEVLRCIINSFTYSSIATAFIVVLAVSAAYVIARKNIPGREILDVIVTMPIAIPGIVIAIGYFTMFLKTPLSPLISPVPLLIMAYTVRRFTFTVRASYAGLLQTHEELEEASLNVGASPTVTFSKIVIPLIAINVLAGGLISFVYAMAEVSTSLILGGVNVKHAPITWEIQNVLYSLEGGQFVAAALGLLLMIMQAIAIAIVNTVLRQRASVIAGL